MEKKGNLIVLCGLPGAGKSTAAKNRGKIFSSDAIRKELFGDESLQYDEKKGKEQLLEKGVDVSTLSADELEKRLKNQGNAQVFSLLHKRIKKTLEKGEDVVYDATNIRRSERKKILKKFSGLYDQAICVFIDVPLSKALAQNAKRARQVNEKVIMKMHARFQKPDRSEGFDEIEIRS
jgi:predicted kinase